VPENQSIQPPDNRILTGSISSNFFSLFIPSIVGLLAFSSASLIDGIFVGNFVGAPALAAINLLIPFINLLCGIGYMLSVGGSVRGGRYIGEGRIDRASAVFSKILILCMGFSCLCVCLGLYFEDAVYQALGATEDLIPLISEYYRIRFPFIMAEMFIIVMYYFVRIDGFATFSAIGILLSSIVNILFDYIFVAELNYGLSGAAWATGIAHISAVLFYFAYFFAKNRNLHVKLKQNHWYEIFHASFNGLSEFINEVSASFVAFALNWLLIISVGTNGVAAITIINYLMLIGIMVVYSISEACQVFVSQNFGAMNIKRIKHFFILTCFACAITSLVLITLLLGLTESIIGMFLDDKSDGAAVLAGEYILILWPIFIFNGFTISISAYLTALSAAKESATIALSRTLVLPCLFMFLLFNYVPDVSFLWALPIAEGLTFLIAMIFFLRHQPNNIRAYVKHD